ncbi:MAG: TauD/TfdA family dioxygenase [Pseudomonadota bacterium]
MSTTPPSKIETDAAWRGSDMAAAPERWRAPLTDEDVAELENAAAHLKSTGVDLGAIRERDFPLPTMAPRLKALREDLIEGVGFGLLTGLPVARYDQWTAAAIFCGIGAHLGAARSQNAAGHLLGHVRDVGADPQDVTTRIYQTSARQTFHTDSADVVGLLCLREAMEGGDSLLVSTVTIYNEMMARRPDLAARLFDPIATDRRGEQPEGEKPFFEIPVLNWHGGRLTGIYQRQYIDSAQRFAEAFRLTPEHVEALDLFDEIANDPALHLRMRLAPGDMQFVYNHAMLHDRTGFRDWPEPERRRHLLRLWLSIPGDRELPPCFAQRYGSIAVGDRGGIVTAETRLHAPLDV